ncbi:hypothetical protein IQ225_16280, partial [Synechocystis salina LEGE 06155]|nr:hypothetical protein [Synechocystis salina LEGE 06155]
MAEAQSSGFNGWGTNFGFSQSFSTDLEELQFLSGLPAVAKAIANPLFNKFILAGVLQGGVGNNPNFSLFGGGVSTDGLLLNTQASVTIKLNDPDDPDSDFAALGGKTPGFSVTSTLAQLFTFSETAPYPIQVETGSVSATLGVKLPIYIPGAEAFPISVDFIGSAGIAFQWQFSPIDPAVYDTPLALVIEPSPDTSSVLGVAILIPPVGALAAIGLAAFSNIAEVIELAVGGIDSNDKLINLDSLLLGIFGSAGLEAALKIPFVLTLSASGQLFLAGTLGETEGNFTGDGTIGFPLSVTAKFLGFLGGTFGIFPSWTFGPTGDGSQDILAQAVLTGDNNFDGAVVDGSLLIIEMPDGINTTTLPDPSQFQVIVNI